MNDFHHKLAALTRVAHDAAVAHVANTRENDINYLKPKTITQAFYPSLYLIKFYYQNPPESDHRDLNEDDFNLYYSIFCATLERLEKEFEKEKR